MGGFNLGAFAGGLGQGFTQGVYAGKTIKKLNNENKVEEAQKQGMTEAEKMRQDALAANAAAAAGVGDIKEVQIAPTMGNPNDPTAGSATPARTEYHFNGTAFNTRAEAEAAKDKAAQATQKEVPDVGVFFARHAVPKIQQLYVAQGDPEKATAWGEYAKSTTGAAAIKSWSGAFGAAQRGDWDAAARGFGQYYTNYIDDGVDYVGHDNVSDDKGNITGFTVQLRNKKTGVITKMPISRESLIKMGVANNPEELFKRQYAEQQAAEKLKAEQAVEANKDAREVATYAKKKQVDVQAATIGKKQDAKIREEEKTTEAQRKDAEPGPVGKKIRDLRASGLYTESEIKAAILAESDDYKKATKPEERAALILSDLTKNDPTFSRKTPAEQQAIVEQMMATIDSVSKKRQDSKTPAAGGLGPSPSKPQKGAAPQTTTPKVPVLDTRTNQIIYR